jgi:hypothetical protein
MLQPSKATSQSNTICRSCPSPSQRRPIPGDGWRRCRLGWTCCRRTGSVTSAPHLDRPAPSRTEEQARPHILKAACSVQARWVREWPRTHHSAQLPSACQRTPQRWASRWASSSPDPGSPWWSAWVTAGSGAPLWTAMSSPSARSSSRSSTASRLLRWAKTALMMSSPASQPASGRSRPAPPAASADTPGRRTIPPCKGVQRLDQTQPLPQERRTRTRLGELLVNGVADRHRAVQARPRQRRGHRRPGTAQQQAAVGPAAPGVEGH